MRRGSAVAIGIVVGTLILSTAVPAQAAVRLRQYKGQTSQAHNISFFVARTDAGRFIKEIEFNVDLTCEDQTTQRVGVGYGFARNQAPITAGALLIDEVDQGSGLHVAGGREGSRLAERTLRSLLNPHRTGDQPRDWLLRIDPDLAIEDRHSHPGKRRRRCGSEHVSANDVELRRVRLVVEPIARGAVGHHLVDAVHVRSCERIHGKIAVGDDVGAIVDLGDSLALDIGNRPDLEPPGTC